jgi:hypothetical protein
MADLVFTARVTIRTQVANKIGWLSLPKNESGQYTHADINQLKKGIERILKQQYNFARGDHGMLAILAFNNYGPKANKTITAADVINMSKKEAEAESTTMGTTVHPKITSRADAQEEAKQLNTNNQALIGAKEGVVKALTTFVGTDITDRILRQANEDFKGLDKYTLHELLKAAVNGVDRPPATDIIDQLLAFFNYAFDMRKKISMNMESLQALVVRMSTYGINIGTAQIALVLIANIELASKEDYGCNFCSTLHEIRAKYPYSYPHNDTSLKDMLQLLNSVDSVQMLTEAPPPASANAVRSVFKMMRTYVTNTTTVYADNDDESNYTESAYGATSDGDSTICLPCCGQKKSNNKDKTKDDKGGGDKKTKKKNDCPHCKKYGNHRPHSKTPHEKCFWNKEWKGWHPRPVCDELEVTFKPHSKFSAELGGLRNDDERRGSGMLASMDIEDDKEWTVVTKGYCPKVNETSKIVTTNNYSILIPANKPTIMDTTPPPTITLTTHSPNNSSNKMNKHQK